MCARPAAFSANPLIPSSSLSTWPESLKLSVWSKSLARRYRFVNCSMFSSFRKRHASRAPIVGGSQPQGGGDPVTILNRRTGVPTILSDPSLRAGPPLLPLAPEGRGRLDHPGRARLDVVPAAAEFLEE